MKIAKEKIAIVGMSFRLPGGIGHSDSLWQALVEQRDLVTEIGPERWDTALYYHPNPATPGSSYVFAAGQLTDIDQFDAQFFGISPREAAQMDPQQRLLLELSWEALADGGQRVELLEGADCAVYMGIASSDYSNRAVDDLAAADAYTMTGNTGSIASNRISYQFNLKGPSVSVDTACSSSLVAVHEACKSIWSGEASCAITGGVNMLLHPSPFVGFSKASMLSPTGRCKPFDASADGYVRSEGAGVLFLKRLSDAQRDGDRIHAVIINSGVNSDGHTASGISVPDVEGQASLLRKLYLDDAPFDLNTLDYLEAHGTGTPVGDPIEAASIGKVLGQSRSHNHALLMGSIKGNVGHLETAAGMAGIIKVIHCLKARAIPPSHLLNELNPAIDFDDLNLQVVREFVSLAEVDRPLKMGVNSFGFGGTNAHVIVEEYRAPLSSDADLPQPSRDSRESNALTLPLYLTANSDNALKKLAADYAELIECHPGRYHDIAAYSLTRQSRLSRGCAIVPASTSSSAPADIMRQLNRIATEAGSIESLARTGGGEGTGALTETEAEENARLFFGKHLGHQAPVVFVYSGNGCQWQGMARQLFQVDPDFAKAIEQLDARFDGLIAFSIIDELLTPEADSHLHLTDYAQPLLFVIQVALTQWFADRGLTPDYVLGHSVGEVAAAWAAGALSLDDAITVIVARSAAQALTRGTGRMAAVGLSLDEANNLLEQLSLEASVEIACHNSADSIVMAGALPSLKRVEEHCASQQRFFRLLDLDYAFHSRYMDPIEKPLVRSLLDIVPRASQRFISSVAPAASIHAQVQQSKQAQPKQESIALDAHYWWRNIREPVQFAAAMEAAIERGGQIFIEIGSQPILQHYINRALRDGHNKGLSLTTLNRKEDDSAAIQQAFFHSFLAGANIRFNPQRMPTHSYSDYSQPLAWPVYPWQRTRHWYDSSIESDSVVLRRSLHPLLGYRVNQALPVWQQQLDAGTTEYLADHIVNNAVVFPGAAYVELGLAAYRDWYANADASFDLGNIDIVAPLVLTADEQRSLRTEIDLAQNKFTISSRLRLSRDQWTQHCTGKIYTPGAASSHSAAAVSVYGAVDEANTDQWAVEGFTWANVAEATGTTESRETIAAKDFYQQLADHGLQYGTAFQCIKSISSGSPSAESNTQSLVLASVGSDLAAHDQDKHILHPVILDACFQLAAALPAKLHAARTYLPVRVGRLQKFSDASIERIAARLVSRSDRSMLVDFALFDSESRQVALASGCRFKAVPVAPRQQGPQRYGWQPVLSHRLEKSHFFSEGIDDFAGWYDGISAAANAAMASDQVRQHYTEVQPLFDSLVGFAALEILQALADEQGVFSLTEALLIGKVPLTQQHFFDYLLAIALQDRLIEPHGEGQYVITAQAFANEAGYSALWRLMVEEFPGYIAQLQLLFDTVNKTLRYLRRDTDTETDVNTGTGRSDHENRQSLKLGYTGLDRLVQSAVRQLLASRSRLHNIDVLELADGDSLVGEALIGDLLDNDGYAFFSSDAASVNHLAEALSELVGFTAATIDDVSQLEASYADKPSAASDQQYDLIVLSHFLSLARQPNLLLRHLQQRLKPGGLILIAGQPANRLSDFVLGASPSWWSRSTSDQRHSQLLSAAAIEKVLAESCQHASVINRNADSEYLVLAQTAAQLPVHESDASSVPHVQDTLFDSADHSRDAVQDNALQDSSVQDKAVHAPKSVWMMLVSDSNKAAMQAWWQRLQSREVFARQIDLQIIAISSVGQMLHELAPMEMLGFDNAENFDSNTINNTSIPLNSVEHWQTLWSMLAVAPSKIIDATFYNPAATHSSSDSRQYDALSEISYASAASRCDNLLALLQFLQVLREQASQSQATVLQPELDILTQSADVAPADAAIKGMARVAMNEYPQLSLRLIDIDRQCLGDSADLLFEELLSGSRAHCGSHQLARRVSDKPVPATDNWQFETEVILSAGSRYVNRLVLKPSNTQAPQTEDDNTVRYLGFNVAGQLKNLQWYTREASELAANAVVVKPRYAGLNFRDVMFATGLLPDEALENGFSGPALGMEFSGEVIAVGTAVNDLAVGDAVMGFGSGCFADQIVTDATAVVKKPAHWSFAAAATVPTVFFTAYYSLVHLARLQPGEKLLIHGAAGGVGLAAIQIARAQGACIYATAGSDEKRDLVAMLGADHVFDSRSLDFADQINAMSGGVDVVLNSLAGEAMERSLGLLKPFGRFLELGKRDFYADSPLGLRPFRNNISYFGIDADQLMSEQPQLIQPLFDALLSRFETGEFNPISYRIFTANQTVDAFRYMQRARQVGKVLIDLTQLPAASTQLAQSTQPAVDTVSGVNKLSLSPDACYLVTGGSNGLGLATAKRLVERGARHIAIVSRRGMIDMPAMLQHKAWLDEGVNVVDIRIDLAGQDCELQLRHALLSLPPLRGVIHAATRIDDALLEKMNADKLSAVLAPKVNGALALHRLTSDCDLDFFVLYSSATTLLGNPGQANYVAANSYLESLVTWRRSQQLPALCLGWGVIDDVGFLSRNNHLKQALMNRLGGAALSADQVLAQLETAIVQQHNDYSYLTLDWTPLNGLLPAVQQPKYAYFNRFIEAASVTDTADLRSRLAAMLPEQRPALVYNLLSGQVKKILCLDSEEIDVDQSLFEQGMDSLMGVELAAAVESTFAVQISAMALAEGPTIRRVGDTILRQMQLSGRREQTLFDEHPVAPELALDDETQERLDLLVSRHGDKVSAEEYAGIKSNLIKVVGKTQADNRGGTAENVTIAEETNGDRYDN